MSDRMHHNHFSAADIEKYRKGLLTPAQMHALEKAAMEDPFLADAMEGYGVGVPVSVLRQAQDHTNRGGVNVESDIKELGERLRKRVEGGKLRTMGFGWWKIAAAIIVVAGGIWTYSAMNNSPAERDIAASKVANAPQHPTPVATDTVQATGNTNALRDAAQVNTQHKKDSATALRSDLVSNTPAAAAGAAKDSGSYYTYTKPAAKENNSPTKKSLVNDDIVEKKLENRMPGLKSDTVEYQHDEALARQYRKSREVTAQRRSEDKSAFTRDTVHEYKVAIRGYLNSPLNTFNGRILDKLNKPVAGASIEIPGRQQSYATDSLGYFSFKAPDTSLKVSVASVGYVQRYYTLRNNSFNNSIGFDNSNNASSNNGIVANSRPAANNAATNIIGFYSNQIVLQPSNPALNEVVVVGYGARKKELMSNRDQKDVAVLDAAPDTGWDDYNDYLEKNKKIPDGADDIHGSVVVRFNIDNNGTMKNFAIEKSLNETLDAEAIRLVKEGPSWHLLKGKRKNSKVTVRVRF